MSVKASPGGSNLSSWASPSLGNMPPAGRPKTLSGSEPGTAKRTSSPTSQTSPVATKVAKTTKTGSGKRLACDNCRERKVRCNREQPVCGRCSRLGHGCRYTTPAKHNASQTDVSQLLLTLHSRLAQTEARLAINPPLPDPNQGAMNPPFLDSNRGIGCNPMIPGGLDIPNMDFIDPRQQFPRPGMNFLDSMNMDEHMLQSDFDAWGNLGLENDPGMDFGFDKPPTTTHFTFDQPVPPLPLSPLSSGSTSNSGALDGEIPLQTLRILHYAYFDIAHHTIPIVNQDRFTMELSKLTLSPQVTSLSYAMASLGASLMDAHGPTKDRSYQLARKHFEVCEREEDCANLMSIEALQACILITCYELRGKGLARAWMSLGRAIRLAQMMGLDRMDADPGSNNAPKFQQMLPAARSPLELEERRKAFWVLFIIDAYASVRSGNPVAIDQAKVTTTLPCPQSIPEPDQAPMPSLNNAKVLYGTDYLSSFTGVVLMVSLYRRCSTHVELSLDNESAGSGSTYSFWEHHYSIDKDVKACGDALMGTEDAQALLQDEIALALSLNLSAIDICLHEAAIVKADKDGLPKALITECNSRCGEAAMRIAEKVSLIQKSVQPKKTAFRQMNIYCLWPVCKAMQVLDRQLSSVTGNAQMADTIGVLKLLVTGIEDLEDVSGHWMDSISHIVKRLEEMDSTGVKTTEFGV